MKKSRSSIPRFEAKWDEPNPDGFDGTEGAREEEDPEGEERVAMQVGKTKEGSGLPANLSTNLDQYWLNLHGIDVERTLVWSNLWRGVSEGAGRSTAGELPVPLSWEAKVGQFERDDGEEATHHYDGGQASSRHCKRAS